MKLLSFVEDKMQKGYEIYLIQNTANLSSQEDWENLDYTYHIRGWNINSLVLTECSDYYGTLNTIKFENVSNYDIIVALSTDFGRGYEDIYKRLLTRVVLSTDDFKSIDLNINIY